MSNFHTTLFQNSFVLGVLTSLDLSIQHGGRDQHTYTTKQLKSAKSTTYQVLQN
jgi:hypothetical protein